MANTAYSQYERFGNEPDILMYTVNYAARPVIVDDAGVTADEYGKKIVPAGTFLGGFFERPNDPAAKIGIDSVKATLKTALAGDDNDILFTAKGLGSAGNAASIAYVDPGANNAGLSVSVRDGAITVSLATNAAGVITTTAEEIAAAINGHMQANNIVFAEAEGRGVVTALAKTNLSGGVNGAEGSAEGVLRHSVDVTHGTATGAAIISGFINLDLLPDMPTDAIKTAMPTIKFMRRD